MKSKAIQQVEKVTPQITNELIGVWESSVRATHHFLDGDAIDRIKKEVAGWLPWMEFVLTAQVADEYVGFLAGDDTKIQMLFVRAEDRGKGYGRSLVQDALSKRPITHVDVNEQNPDAKAFYERMGFEVFERSQTDSSGNPYPILHMKRAWPM